MHKGEFVLKLSSEGRAWAHMLWPVLSAFVTGWHIPRPWWAKRK
jgi:hypothetical protein